MVDEGFNLGFEITGQEVVFQQNAVLQGLMPPRHASVSSPCFAAIPPDPQSIAGTIITEQTRLVNNVNLVATGRLKGQVQGVGHILSPHVGAEFPCDDVTVVIVHDRAEIEPTPTDDLEVGEVGLPQRVGGRGFVFEFARRLDRHQ